MTKSKILLGAGSLVATLALVAGPLAVGAVDDLTQENVDTGNNSENRNNLRINRRDRQRQINRARARNYIEEDLNTGHNESEENTNGGSVNSGNIAGDVLLTNVLNEGLEPLAPAEPSDATVDQTNEDTGNNSVNTNRLRLRERTSTRQVNRARARNTVKIDANTGHNEAEENTNSGDVDSGNINLTVDVFNSLNSTSPDLPEIVPEL